MRIRFTPAVLLLLAVTACQDRSPVGYEGHRSDQKGYAAAALEGIPAGIDEHYVELAQRVPGYGGHYFAEDHRLVVNLKDTTQVDAAHNALAGTIKDYQRMEGATVSLEFRTAEYEFLELTRWRGRLPRAIGGIPGVTLIMTDPLRNRLVIGVADDRTAEQVVTGLERNRIPRGAVIVERASLQLEDNLKERSYVLQGGRQIYTPANWLGKSGGCSIGYVGRGKPGTIFAGYNYLLTASHCTRTLDANNGIQFRQPDAYDDIIGDESFGDLRYYHYDVYNWPCYYPEGCRQSEVVLVRLNGSRVIGEGEVARPAGIGSIEISSTDPPFRVDSILTTRNIQGRTVHKIGINTGWTYGTVANTCADLRIPDGRGGYIRIICMNPAGYNSASGDSGGPVFLRVSGSHDRIIMAGVHHGKITLSGSTYTVFSHPWSIDSDISSTSNIFYGTLNGSLWDIDWDYYN